MPEPRTLAGYGFCFFNTIMERGKFFGPDPRDRKTGYDDQPQQHNHRGIRDYMPGQDDFDEDFSDPENHFFDDDFDEFGDDDDYDDDFEDGFYEEDEDEWRYEEFYSGKRRSRQFAGERAYRSHPGMPGRSRLLRRRNRERLFAPAGPARFSGQPAAQPPRFGLAAAHVHYPGIRRVRTPRQRSWNHNAQRDHQK
jgi:hypothetical protein